MSYIVDDKYKPEVEKHKWYKNTRGFWVRTTDDARLSKFIWSLETQSDPFDKGRVFVKDGNKDNCTVDNLKFPPPKTFITDQDPETKNFVNSRAWRLSRRGYWTGYFNCACHGKRPQTMHRMLFNLSRGICPAEDDYYKEGLHIAHVNHNKNDNRLENLQLQSASFNCSDHIHLDDNRLGISDHHGKYRVRVTKNGQRTHVGRYNTIPEAAAARNSFLEQHKLSHKRTAQTPGTPS